MPHNASVQRRDARGASAATDGSAVSSPGCDEGGFLGCSWSAVRVVRISIVCARFLRNLFFEPTRSTKRTKASRATFSRYGPAAARKRFASWRKNDFIMS